MNEKDTLRLFNELIKALPGFAPLEGPTNNEGEQRMGLAQAFSNKGFRDYLRKTILQQVTHTIDVQNMEGLWIQKGRIEAIKEIYRISEQCFKEGNKLAQSLKEA